MRMVTRCCLATHPPSLCLCLCRSASLRLCRSACRCRRTAPFRDLRRSQLTQRCKMKRRCKVAMSVELWLTHCSSLCVCWFPAEQQRGLRSLAYAILVLFTLVRTNDKRAAHSHHPLRLEQRRHASDFRVASLFFSVCRPLP